MSDIIKKDENELINNAEYLELLEKIKIEITAARNKAVISANEHMIRAYYNIGKSLLEKNKWRNEIY